MIYVLTLLVFSAGNVTVAPVEYNTAQACEAAKQAAIATFPGAVGGVTKVAGTCTPKG